MAGGSGRSGLKGDTAGAGRTCRLLFELRPDPDSSCALDSPMRVSVRSDLLSATSETGRKALRRSVLLLAMTLALGTGVSSAAQAADPIPVGAIIALSGPCAAYGIAIHAGLELALEGVNVHGVLGGRKIALMVEDSAGNKEQAIDAARKLIGREKVIAIIGPTLSDEMFAVGPITNERQIPTIGTSTAPSVSPPSGRISSAPRCPRPT